MNSATMTDAPPRHPGGAVLLRASRARSWNAARLVHTLSWINLAAVVIALLLICVVSERWWLSALLTYLPRQLYALPALVLLPASLLLCRRVAWINAFAALLVVGPIMGLTMPVGSPAATAAARPLRIVSGNLQQGQGSLRKLLREIEVYRPDILIFQEAAQGTEPLEEVFADWERVHLQSFLVVSRYPLRVVDHCRAKAFGAGRRSWWKSTPRPARSSSVTCI